MTAASPITTHVLDTRTGKPACHLGVLLEKTDDGGGWAWIAQGATNDDGRITDLIPAGTLTPGIHRITFDTGAYFATEGIRGFYPEVTVVFEITDPTQHCHVPLLLSPFGYSTYRGS